MSVPGGASTSTWRRWRPGRFVLVVVAFYAYAALVALAFTVHAKWSAPTWRRATTWHGHAISVPVPLALRLATTPRGTRWLDGRQLDTAYGRVEFAREPGTGRLLATCEPCRFTAPAFGDAPVDVRRATLTIGRVEDHLAGELRLDGVALGWHGYLTDGGLRVHFAMPATSLATALQPFVDAVPEIRYARLDGTVALHGDVAWPGGDVNVEPAFDGLRVEGLGTERLTTPIRAASCRVTTPRIGAGPAWRRLGAAVIAAEDQRYYEHPGYDLEAMRVTLVRNAADRRIAGGASTITQQLARIVYTGADRELPRKLRELLYAVEMERTLGKAKILDLYLAMAPWGSGGCGAQAAARGLYAKALEELDVADLVRLAAALRDDERWRDTDEVVRIARQMRGITRTERSAAIAALCTGGVSAECLARELWARGP